MMQQQPGDQLKREPSIDNGVQLSKWWSVCQPKYITCAAVVFGLTFILITVTEQTNMVEYNSTTLNFNTKLIPPQSVQLNISISSRGLELNFWC